MDTKHTQYIGYLVSSCGKVFSDKGKTRKELKQYYNTELGYMYITLSVKGKRVCKRVHRLIAESFVPNPLDKPEVDHLDRDRTNNNKDNLRWATRLENCDNRVLHTRAVAQYTLKGELVKKYKSIVEAHKLGGFRISCICAVCSDNYLNKTHRGFIWKYL